MINLSSWFCLIASWLLSASNPNEPPLHRFDYSQRMMGISFDISVYASSETSANEAVEEAYGQIRRLNSIFSDYEPDSELNRLCKSAGTSTAIPVSPELWDILKQSVELSKASSGGFDVTVGPIVRLWRKARRAKKLPTVEQLQSALASVGYQKLKFNSTERTVELMQPNMQLDLGGIAVGYTCDLVLKGLQKHGLRRVLINASGDILAGDPPPGEPGWRIGIATPNDEDATKSRVVLLNQAACSTSGDLYQHVEFDGVRYSHIVDPKTGLGLTDRSMVTVIAPNCVSADAWSTTLSILGPEAGLQFLKRQPEPTRSHTAAVIMRAISGQDTFETIESPLFSKFLLKD